MAASAPWPAPCPDADRRRRQRMAAALAALAVLGLALGLVTGPRGLGPAAWSGFHELLGGEQAGLVLGHIRAPRTLGAMAVGALLALAGALAQGLFRNPLADPYLLGTAAGAGLGVVLALAGGSLAGASLSLAALGALERVGLAGAAFAGALAGVALTLVLAQGAVQTLRLLLAGIVVAVLLGSVTDLVTVVSPEALRARQAFMLGNTSLLGWGAVALLACGLAPLVLLARRYARALDALTLGEDGAASLGLDLQRVRAVGVAALALATALAVSQAGLVAFVGLVAPHLVRRHAPGGHAWLLGASAAMGAVLLLWADIAARAVMAPQELPVGLVTGILGGAYLFVLLKRGWR